MDLMKKTSPFERDFPIVKEYFPLLSYSWSLKSKSWIITGELDICDVKGDYWNTFDIAIIVPKGYPNCVPVVFERSEISPRDIDWHISKEGTCCVDVDNNLLVMSRTGINIKDFISQKVIHILRINYTSYKNINIAGEEYGHHTDGIIQYYVEELNIPTADDIIIFIEMILNKTDLTRNSYVPVIVEEK